MSSEASALKMNRINKVYDNLEYAVITKSKWGHREIFIAGNKKEHCKVSDLIKKIEDEINKGNVNVDLVMKVTKLQYLTHQMPVQKTKLSQLKKLTNAVLHRPYTSKTTDKDDKIEKLTRQVITLATDRALGVETKETSQIPLKKDWKILCKNFFLNLIKTAPAKAHYVELNKIQAKLKPGTYTIRRLDDKRVEDEVYILITKEELHSIKVTEAGIVLRNHDPLGNNKLKRYTSFETMFKEMKLYKKV